MELNVNLDVITITYEPTGQEVFKSTEINGDGDGEGDMNSLKYKIGYADMIPEHLAFAEEKMVMYDGEMNAEGYDELHRFLSYVEDCDFFKVKYTTVNVTV